MSVRADRGRTVPVLLALLGVAVLAFGVALVEGRVTFGPLPLDAVTVLVPVAIVALLPLARRQGMAGVDRLGILAPLAAFLALQAIVIAVNGFGTDMYATFVRYAGYALLLVCIAIVSRQRSVRRWFSWLVFGAGVAVSVVGIVWYVQRLIAFHITAGSTMLSTPAIRVVSTFANANFLGEYLVIVLGVALALALAERGWRRLVAWMGLLLVALCIILTYTRGSWLAVAVAFGIALLVLGARYFWGLVIVGGIGVAVIPGFLARLMSSFSTGGTAGFRLRLWRIAGQAMADRPVFGWGPGRFYDAFTATVIKHPELGVGYLVYGAHNSYYTLMTETGIIGGLAFLVFVLTVVRMGVRVAERATRALRFEAVALTAGLAGFAINALTSNSFQHPQAAVFFWIVAGLLGGLALEVGAIPRAEAAIAAAAPGPWVAGSAVVRAFAPLRAALGRAWHASATRSALLGEGRRPVALLEGSAVARLLFGKPPAAEEATR